jgi:hypothetical protein
MVPHITIIIIHYILYTVPPPHVRRAPVGDEYKFWVCRSCTCFCTPWLEAAHDAKLDEVLDLGGERSLDVDSVTTYQHGSVTEKQKEEVGCG